MPRFTVFEIPFIELGISNFMELSEVQQPVFEKAIETHNYRWNTSVDYNSLEELEEFLGKSASVGRKIDLIVQYEESGKGEIDIISLSIMGQRPLMSPSKQLDHQMTEVRAKQDVKEVSRKVAHTHKTQPKILPTYKKVRHAHFSTPEAPQFIFPTMNSEESQQKLQLNKGCNWLVHSGQYGILTIEFLDNRGECRRENCLYDKSKGWLMGDDVHKAGTTLSVTNKSFASYSDAFFQKIKEKYGLDKTSMLTPENEQMAQTYMPGRK